MDLVPANQWQAKRHVSFITKHVSTSTRVGKSPPVLGQQARLQTLVLLPESQSELKWSGGPSQPAI